MFEHRMVGRKHDSDNDVNSLKLRSIFLLLYYAKYISCLLHLGCVWIRGCGEWKVEGEWEWKCEESVKKVEVVWIERC